MQKRRLLIVSDTRMQRVGNQVWAFNSVVKELDVFIKLFEEIVWIGFDYDDLPLDGTLLEIKYTQVKPILVKSSGGAGFWAKLGILRRSPLYLYLIWKYSKCADIIHSRGPSSPMFFALILSFVCKKPKWWFKYANDWSDSNPPWTWRIQRSLMKKNIRSVGTINGVWPNQPSHILSFENPCFDSLIDEGYSELRFHESRKWRLLYVGRIESKKGIALILDFVSKLHPDLFHELNFIGDGIDSDVLKKMIVKNRNKNRINYLGPKNKDEVFKYMRNSHFLLLPTVASEGFPKVIAEAWLNGCIPIVSSVSSISQYAIDNQNSFIFNISNGGTREFESTAFRAFSLDLKQLETISKNGQRVCDLFTYERYQQRIINEIIPFLY